MKESDFRQAERILRAIQQITAAGCIVELHADNPAEVVCSCAVLISGPRNIAGQWFYGTTIMKCLQDAMIARGIVEELPTEAEKPETRMYPAATAIVVLMKYFWGVREYLQQAAARQKPLADFCDIQRDQIRRAMGLAEDALKPILEGLAGYCWVDLPEDVQNACRAAGVDAPDPWSRQAPPSPGQIRHVPYQQYVAQILQRIAAKLGLAVESLQVHGDFPSDPFWDALNPNRIDRDKI